MQFLLPLLVVLLSVSWQINANAMGGKRLTMDDCKISWNIWMGPPPLFGGEYDQTCVRAVRLKEMPLKSDCGDDTTIHNLYPDFQAEGYSSIQKVNAGELIVHGDKFYSYSEYKAAPQFSKGVDLEKYAFDRFYCHKKNPEKVQDAFASGFDVPAKSIQLWTKQYIEYKWKEKLPALIEKYKKYDIPAMYELNIVGSDIWESIEKCFNGNAEEARRAYYLSKYSCTNDAINGEVLRSKVGNYLGSVEAFFMTSYFKKPELKVKNALEFMDLVNKKESYVDIEIGEMPSLHPLFVQAAMQTLVKLYPIGENKDARDFDAELKQKNIDSTLFTNISQFFSIIPKIECNSMGLWPSIGRATYSSILVTGLNLIKTIAPRGYEVKDYNIQPVGCGSNNDYRLSYFYSDNKDILALEMREIGARYKKAEEKK